MIDTIMLFAAGRGTRMLNLTKNKPKTLINILKRPILYYALDLCKTYPFKKIVINTHYLHQQIEESIKKFKETNLNFPEIILINEEELLETGGAIKNAKKILGDKEVFTLNTDVILQSKDNIFRIMQEKWNSRIMDFLLLMQPCNKAVGYTGKGDFDLYDDGKLLREEKKNKYEYIYTGLQILKPEIIYANPAAIFSLNEYYFNNPMVRGISIKDTKWYHASRPEDLKHIEKCII